MYSPGRSSSTVPLIRTIALAAPTGPVIFKERIVRSGMEFETAGESAGLPAGAGVLAATEDDGVLVLEISGLPAGFCPQPATTVAVSAQVKNSPKLLKYFTLTCPSGIPRQSAANPGRIRFTVFTPQHSINGEHVKLDSQI
ncbi:MAG: hypothetical protein ABSE90_06245 [Verrucomicrobiota bacterium]